MTAKKLHAPYRPRNTNNYMQRLRAELFAHIRKMIPIIKSICSKDSLDGTLLSKKLPLKSLEGVYLSKVFDSADRDYRNWYSDRRTEEIFRCVKTHELTYFKGKEKPTLILKLEDWCKNRLAFEHYPECASFQLICLTCENIIHWQKKSRWDLNAPQDKAEDFIVESLEEYLYDWLCCISNDKEKIDVIRDPIRLVKALAKMRSKPVNHAEMVEVIHFYLSLLVELKFLTVLEGEDVSGSVCTSANEATIAVAPTNLRKRYILGTFCWTIHQDTSIVPFFPFDLKECINQKTFWSIIRRNCELDKENLHRYYFFYEKFFLFAPTKRKLCPPGIQPEHRVNTAFICLLPVRYPSALAFLKEYTQKQRWILNLLRASHLFYVVNFHYQEFLDLAALDCYDIEINSQRYCIDDRVFIDYYASMEKSDECAYRWGNVGDKELPL